MTNLKVNTRLWLVVLGAIAVAVNGCNLSPQPEPPAWDTSGPTTGGNLGGEANEVPGMDGASDPNFSADAGALPQVPPGARADAGPADSGLLGDAGEGP